MARRWPRRSAGPPSCGSGEYGLGLDQRPAQLLAELRALGVPVPRNSVGDGRVEHLLVLARDGQGAPDVAGHGTAIDHLAAHLNSLPLRCSVVLCGGPRPGPSGKFLRLLVQLPARRAVTTTYPASHVGPPLPG